MTDPTKLTDHLKLFVVPVTYALTTNVYVLAVSRTDAEDKARTMDYDELLFIGENLVQSLDETKLEFNDFDVTTVDLTGITPDTTSRDPREHTDWPGSQPIRK